MDNNTKNKEENVQKIIFQIYKKGVMEAEEKKDAILKQASQEAQAVLQKAKDEAAKILADTTLKTSGLAKNAECQIQKSLKNATELLKQKTVMFLTNLLTEMTRKELDNSQFLNNLILEAVKKWANGEEITISTNTKILEHIDKNLLEGKTLEINDSLHGFTIRKEGDFITWEVTDESVVEILTPLLSTQIAELFRKTTSKEDE